MNKPRYPDEFKAKPSSRSHSTTTRSLMCLNTLASSSKPMQHLLNSERANEKITPVEGTAQASDRGARHIKKGRRVLCQAVRVKYALIKRHEREHTCPSHAQRHDSALQRVLRLEGRTCESKSSGRSAAILGLLKQAWLESGGVWIPPAHAGHA